MLGALEHPPIIGLVVTVKVSPAVAEVRQQNLFLRAVREVRRVRDRAAASDEGTETFILENDAAAGGSPTP